MKKSLLALSAAVIALSASASTTRQQQRHAAHPISFDRSVELKSPDGRTLRSASSTRKAPAKVNAPEDIITSPEGRRQAMTSTATGFYVVSVGNEDYLDMYFDQQFASHFIYGDDNDVYIYDIVPGVSTGSYVKGKIDGDKITVDLPQTVLWSEFEQDGVNVNICEMNEDEETGDFDFSPVSGASLVLTVAEDGSVVAEDLSEERTLGLTYCSDDVWAGFCAMALSFSTFDSEFVTVPSDIEVSKDFWSYSAEGLGYGWPVSFAQGGEEVYFQGLSEIMPEAWVKATVEYDETEAHVYIAQNQLVGTYDGAYVYTKCAETVTMEMFGSVYEFYELLPDDYRFELVWDYEEETMKVKDSNVSLLYNIILDDVDYIDDMYDFTLSIQDSFAGTPANPENLTFENLMEFAGYSIFRYDLPGYSTEGDMLLTSGLSYVVYVDGEEWTFEPEDYMLDEPMVQIPWLFNDYWIMKWPGSTAHGVALFVDGITTIGVQSIYEYNGEETRSEIVTLNLDDPSAVDGIVDVKKVAEVKYYGIDGREVANPAAGIFVKRVTFEDGSVATFKKAIR